MSANVTSDFMAALEEKKDIAMILPYILMSEAVSTAHTMSLSAMILHALRQHDVQDAAAVDARTLAAAGCATHDGSKDIAMHHPVMHLHA